MLLFKETTTGIEMTSMSTSLVNQVVNYYANCSQGNCGATYSNFLVLNFYCRSEYVRTHLRSFMVANGW